MTRPANKLLQLAGGRWASERQVAARHALVGAVAALWGSAFLSCTPASTPTQEGGGFAVDVVDAKGSPLAEAEVEGLVDFNPGPVASTCCTEKPFASGTTSKNGRVMLAGAPRTFRAFHFRASFRNWPSREVTVGSLLGHDGVLRISLGPARAVRGRVDFGPGCPLPSGLEVSASPPEERAKVAPDGSFVFESLAPWASVWVYACNRGARLELDIRDDRPVVLALPQAESP